MSASSIIDSLSLSNRLYSILLYLFYPDRRIKCVHVGCTGKRNQGIPEKGNNTARL